MEIAHLEPVFGEVVGEVLGHALGERGDQHPSSGAGHLFALGEQIVHLVLDRAPLDLGIDQASRTDHLLDDHPAGVSELEGAGGGGDEDRLGPVEVPLLEFERAVVHAGGKAEPVFGECGLAVVIAAEHAAELGHGDVALIDDEEGVFGEVFEKGGRRLAGATAGQVARIVLDSLAAAGGLQHFEIEGGALFEPLRFEELARGVELGEPLAQFRLDPGDRLGECGARRDVVTVGVDGDDLELMGALAGERVELVDRLDLVIEQGDAPGAVLIVGGEDVDRLAGKAEGAALEEGVVAAVLQLDQAAGERGAVDPRPAGELDHHARIGFDRADAIDRGDRGHDHHVAPLEQGAGRGMAHAVDRLVDLGVLLDISVGPWHIGLGLVIIVVAHEIFDGVLRKERLHLAVELGGERLVGGEDEGRALHRLDHLGHGEGLARTGHPEQHLIALPPPQPFGERGDRLRLIPRRLIGRMDPERAQERPRRLLGRDEEHGMGGPGERAQHQGALSPEDASSM